MFGQTVSETVLKSVEDRDVRRDVERSKDRLGGGVRPWTQRVRRKLWAEETI